MSFLRDILMTIFIYFSHSHLGSDKKSTVERGKGNLVLRSLEYIEHELKEITQGCDSRDVSLVDRLSELKYSHEDKIGKVKLINKEFLNLLEIKNSKVNNEEILKREDIFFQVKARVGIILKHSVVVKKFTFSSQPFTLSNSVVEIT